MKVLMVCLGNICRSPLAHGILQSRIDALNLDWEVDSAGTSAWHVGRQPDHRSIAIARDHGIDISNQRARQFTSVDLEYYDVIYVMDSSNYQSVRQLDHTNRYANKIKLLLNNVYPEENRAVPDPYYDNNFQEVFLMVEQAVNKLLEQYI
jgi:protein-tyrosine phosphatase